MKSLDFEQIDVIDFLEALGIRNVTDEGDEVRYSCPLAGHLFGDEKPSAYMNKETTAFFCHGCKEAGNAVSFIVKHLGVSPLEALRALRDRYMGFSEPEGTMAQEWDKFFQTKPPEAKIWNGPDEEVLLRFSCEIADLQYMLDRGFTPATLAAWDIGLDPRTRRVTIPVREIDGTLIGFKARATDDRHPKYLVLGDTHRVQAYGFDPYEASSVVFGLDRCAGAISAATPNTGTPRHLIICEGELNVIAAWQHGFTNVAGISGSEMSMTQARKIRQVADSVTLFFDSDKAGERGAMKAMNLLYPFIPVWVVGPHQGDAASLSSQEVRDLLDGAYRASELIFDEV